MSGGGDIGVSALHAIDRPTPGVNDTHPLAALDGGDTRQTPAAKHFTGNTLQIAAGNIPVIVHDKAVRAVFLI